MRQTDCPLADCRLPDFLVIGGMKCGSTTLYRDLLGHPDIYLPDKELNVLMTQDANAGKYARHFAAAPPASICGDVSTTYSMIPDYSGVAERAARILSSRTRIIYLVREPVSRAISHHRHMNAWHGPGKMGQDVDIAVQQHASIVNYNRYAMQLRPWRNAFGDDAIRVVVFEEYIADRRGTIERLLGFMGVRPDAQYVCADKVFNGSDGKTVLNSFWRTVWESQLYQRMVRSRMSLDLRESLRRLMLPSAPQRPAPPSIETVDYLIKNVCEDEKELREFLGRGEPLWDFGSVRAACIENAARVAA